MQTRTEKRRSRIGLRPWGWVLAAVALAVGSWAVWRHVDLERAAARSAAGTTQISAPVHVATVERRDVPVILNGLGTVQALNTVTVRSQVDGQIEKVAFRQGQIVHEGDLLVQIDPAPFQATLDEATAKLAHDQADLNNAKLNLQRTSTLARKGFATQQLLDQQTANVSELTAQIQGDQAAIDAANVLLGYTTIKSPLTGRAGFRLIDPGNIVHANDPTGIVTITQISPISVVFTAPEGQLPNISEALKSRPVQVAALTSDGHRVLAKGALIDNQVDQATGTIRLKASFDNADQVLWPGLSVSTQLRVKTLKSVVAVPALAVQRGPNGLYAFVVTKDGTAELRDLQVGPIEDGWAVIEKGLNPGERVVTSGQYRVEPGAPVEILHDQDQRAVSAGVKP